MEVPSLYDLLFLKYAILLMCFILESKGANDQHSVLAMANTEC